MRPLNYRERLFALHYCGEAKGNAAQAARMAGYSERGASAQGNKLLRNPQIWLLVQKKTQSAAMDAEEVLARLSDMASTDIDDFMSMTETEDEYDEAGNIKKRGRRELAFDYEKARRRGKLGSIKKLEVMPGGGIRFELHDAQSALEKLMKYYGMGRERIEISHVSDGTDTIQRLTAVLCGVANLSRTTLSREGISAAFAGSLRGGGVGGAVDAGPASGAPQSTPALDQPTADHAIARDPGPAPREIGTDLEAFPGVVSGDPSGTPDHPGEL